MITLVVTVPVCHTSAGTQVVQRHRAARQRRSPWNCGVSAARTAATCRGSRATSLGVRTRTGIRRSVLVWYVGVVRPGSHRIDPTIGRARRRRLVRAVHLLDRSVLQLDERVGHDVVVPLRMLAAPRPGWRRPRSCRHPRPASAASCATLPVCAPDGGQDDRPACPASCCRGRLRMSSYSCTCRRT